MAAKPRQKAPASAIPCPETLTEAGRDEWQNLAPVARRLGTLTDSTARSFELLVETLATERKARDLVEKAGITVSTGRGGVKPHPAVRTMETARVQAAALLRLFRLDPGNPAKTAVSRRREAKEKEIPMGRGSAVTSKRYPAPLPLFPIATAPTCALDMLPVVPDPTGRGARAWEILRRLPITEGTHAGKRIGENAPPWMPRFTKLIFGHTDQAGLRVLREVFASIGKKSAKTAFAAAVAMTKLLLEEEQRDYVVLLGGKPAAGAHRV